MAQSIPVRTVLFDYDGTLTNSMVLFEAVVKRALAWFKRPVTPEREQRLGREIYAYSVQTVPRGGRLLVLQTFYSIGRICDLSPPKAVLFTAYCLLSVRRQYHKVELKPDATKVLQRLQDEGLVVGLVTMASAKEVLTKPELLQFFQTVVTRADVTEGKPSPEGLLRAMEEVRADACSTVYVGDLPTDILAAQAAKIRVVSVAGQLVPREMLVQLRPDHFATSLTDVMGWVLAQNQSS